MAAGDNRYFSDLYKESRCTRIFTHILLLLVASIPASAGINGSPEYLMRVDAAEGLDIASSGGVISWCSCLMLLRTYNFNRAEFWFGLVAGALAIAFGDFLAALYWAGITALFISLLKYHTGPLFLYAIIAGGAATESYYEIYEFSQPGTLNIILVLTVLTGLFRETLWEKLKSIRSTRAVQPKIVEQQQHDEVKPRPVRAPQADESVWGPGEKEVQAFEEYVPEPPVPEEKPTLTADQRPFAVYWLELHKLKQQPALSELLQSELNGVISYCERILECMQEDPNDVQPGSAFLDRYLTQVTTVVKRGLLLSGQLSTHGKTQEVEQQCLNALQALNSAFAQQHLRLLENDTLAFETDLTVLNSLLKTDGFKQ